MLDIRMGPVEKAIRKTIQEGEILFTPTQSRPFRIGKISWDGLVLEMGNQRTPTKLTWDCLEGVIPLLVRCVAAYELTALAKANSSYRGRSMGILRVM